MDGYQYPLSGHSSPDLRPAALKESKRKSRAFRRALRCAASVQFLFLLHASAHSQETEGKSTEGVACRELGARYATCAFATSEHKKCPSGWDFSEPARCKSSEEFAQGITDTVRARKTAAVSPSGTSGSPAKASKQAVPHRTFKRFSPYECSAMAVQLPQAAYMLASGASVDDVKATIERGSAVTQSGPAVEFFLIVYNNESLRNYAYDMQRDFEKKCKSKPLLVAVD